VRVQRAHAVLGQDMVLDRRVGVPQPVEGQIRLAVFVGNVVAVLEDEELHAVDRAVGEHAVGDEQLVSALGAIQHHTQRRADAFFLDGNGADLAALALDGDGVLAQRALRRRGVKPHDLVDAQPGVPPKVQRAGDVVTVRFDRLADHAVELDHAPRPVHAAEAPPLQRNAELVVVGQTVFRVLHLVMEEADPREVGFDGARGFAAVLHENGVGDKVLAADVRELLQVERLGEIAAKPLHRLVVAPFRLKAPLPVVPRPLVQLGDESEIDVVCRHE